MAASLTTQTKDLGDSRVRVDVEVQPGAIERELLSAAREIGRDLKIPGFRKGKVPPEVVLQRVGRESVLDEAVRSALPGWYEEAVLDAKLVTVGDPKLDLKGLPEKGDPLAFTIEVGVRPPAKLGEYKGLEVGKREPEADPEQVEAELERMRESLASLEPVDRVAQNGDFLVLDFVGRVDGEPFEGGEARGYLLELGSERLIPGFEEQLVGAATGEQRIVSVTFPDDYGAEALAGKPAEFEVDVKEVKEKRVPELDDDFANEAAGFDTLAELREEVERRQREVDESRLEGEFREAAVDAAVAKATIEVPDDLVEAKAREMWERAAHRMQHQGLDPARWLELTGKTEDEVIEESREEALRAIQRESVLAAVVEAEAIEVSDDELLDSLRDASTQPGSAPPEEKKLRKALERIRKQGRDELLREDVAMRKAVDLLADSAKPIAAGRAEARDKLWTPEKGDEGEADAGSIESGSGRIWTPGS